MADIDDLAVWRRKPCFSRQTLAGVLILLPEAVEPVLLNPSAGIAWTMLDEPRALNELRSELIDVFGAESAPILDHLAGALELLVDHGILERT